MARAASLVFGPRESTTTQTPDEPALLEALEEQRVWQFGRDAARGIRRPCTLTGNVIEIDHRHHA